MLSLFAFSFFRRASMPIFSSLRVMKKWKKKEFLTPREKRNYVPREIETDIARMLSENKASFYIVTGPNSIS